MSGTPPFNLMALLAAAQQPGMRGMPAGGPIPAQNPTPGFRPPGAGGVPMPQMQPQQNPMAQAGGLGAAMARMPPRADAGIPGSAQAAQNAVNANGTVMFDPASGLNTTPGLTGGLDPSTLGAAGQGASPGFLDFLTGKMRSLFGPSVS